MNKQSRMKKLQELIKQAELDKTAQDAIDSANNTQDGDEFAHRIFEALLNKIENSGE